MPSNYDIDVDVKVDRFPDPINAKMKGSKVSEKEIEERRKIFSGEDFKL